MSDTTDTKDGERTLKSYYRTCPLCGSNLDPGEHCDCEQEGRGIKDAIDRSSKGSKAGLQKKMVRRKQRKAA